MCFCFVFAFVCARERRLWSEALPRGAQLSVCDRAVRTSSDRGAARYGAPMSDAPVAKLAKHRTDSRAAQRAEQKMG